MIKPKLFTIALLSASALTLSAQKSAQQSTQYRLDSMFEEYENLFTEPQKYVVGYTATPPHIDGNINDEIWSKAIWTDSFQDIEGDLKPKPTYKTQVKMLWDDNYIYFAAQMEEPHVWANLMKRDEIVFFDNDFEIFIDPNNTTHRYFEIEINALNNIFDLFLPRPYRFGGNPLFSWNTSGMKHAVSIQGSLNNASDKDQGWCVEIAVPLTALTIGNDKHLPYDGEVWRLNFSRVEWLTEVIKGKYVKKKDNFGSLPEQNWVWSPQGVIDMHRPERWGYLQFSSQKVEENAKLPQFVMPYHEQQRKYLWLLHYAQNSFREKRGVYAKTLKDLGMDKLSITIGDKQNTLSLSAMDEMYVARITDNDGKTTSINHEGQVSFVK